MAARDRLLDAAASLSVAARRRCLRRCPADPRGFRAAPGQRTARVGRGPGLRSGRPLSWLGPNNGAKALARPVRIALCLHRGRACRRGIDALLRRFFDARGLLLRRAGRVVD